MDYRQTVEPRRDIRTHSEKDLLNATRRDARNSADAGTSPDSGSEESCRGGQWEGRRWKDDRGGEPGAGTGEDGAQSWIDGCGCLRTECADYVGIHRGADGYGDAENYSGGRAGIENDFDG